MKSPSPFTFDFSEQALTKPQEIYDKIIEMLGQRKVASAARGRCCINQGEEQTATE